MQSRSTGQPNASVAVVTTLLALAVISALAAAPTASAKAKPCADQVVADWYGDGRVDKIYPRHCYHEAIRSLSVDVLDYSNAKEDILRALAYARRGQPDAGPAGSQRSTGTGSQNDPSSDPADARGEETTAQEAVDTSGPSAPPIPLLVLSGLALLLLVARGVSYLSRRARTPREGGPTGPN
jgi:hypothetical protein